MFYIELIKELKIVLKKFGFEENKDYGKGFFVKEGDYPFQLAVLRIVSETEKSFYAVLSFDIRVNKGMAYYLEPWRRQKQQDFIYYIESACYHSYHVNDNKVFDYYDYEKFPSMNAGFKSIEDFKDVFETDVMPIIEKYINPYNGIEYFLENNEKYNIKSYAKILALMYEQLSDIENTIIYLQEQYNNLSVSMYGYEKKRYLAYLDYLKDRTPLPVIYAPQDQVSSFEIIGNDIYILVNKKTIKDQEILDLFGSVERFEKAKKVEFLEMIDEEGIGISKLGKWSVLRIGAELFIQQTKESLETMLTTLSEKYSRSILFINQDTSNTFGFEICKKGEFLRRWMSSDGEILENIGKPITGEKKRFSDDYNGELDASDVTGFLDTIMKITYEDVEKSKTVFYQLK